MGKRGPKPRFIDVACPNKNCKLYGLTNQGNVVGNGTYISRGEKTRRYLCRHCGKVFNDHTDTFYHRAYPKSSFNLIIAAIITTPKYDVSLISYLGNTFLHDSIQLKNLSTTLFFLYSS